MNTMKSKQKMVRKVNQRNRQSRQTPEAGENERLTYSGASPGNIIALQHQSGNRAVQRLLADPISGKNIQLAPTPLGAHVEMRDPESKAHLLTQLLSGEKKITDYISGMCYDMAAYILYLRGLVTFDSLEQTNAQNWLPEFDFEGGTLWQGGDIPAGAVVGFKRLKGTPAGLSPFFHAGVGIGGTSIRAINGGKLGATWTDPVDISNVLNQEGPGVYKYEGQVFQVQVWYR